MIHYGYYADLPPGALESLVQSARLCRLVTTGDDLPHIGLYPFTHAEGTFALHLNKTDEQIADLRRKPRCLLVIDEPLAVLPSHWVGDSAAFGTAYHRAATFECTATLVDTPEGVAQVQSELLARYQPEGGYRAITAEDPMYAGMIRMLVGVRLSIDATKVKFKLGQNRDFETRALVVRRLRERGTALDLRTADALEETIRLGWTTQGRRDPEAP